MKKSVCILLGWMLGVCTFSFSQKLVTPEYKSPDHELTGYLGGGFHTALYKPDNFYQKWRMGSTIGVNYVYYQTQEWGILAGCEVSWYKSTIRGDLSENYEIHDGTDIIRYDVEYNNIKETHTYSFLQIPIGVRVKYPFKKVVMYGGAGLKMAFGITGKYDTKIESIYTSGTNESTSQKSPRIPEQGFGRYTDQSTFGHINVKMALLAYAEAGVGISIKKRQILQLGFYFEYGLNNMAKPPSPIGRILDYHTNFKTTTHNSNLKLNGVMVSGSDGIPHIAKMHLLTIGLKIGYALGLSQ